MNDSPSIFQQSTKYSNAIYSTVIESLAKEFECAFLGMYHTNASQNTILLGITYNGNQHIVKNENWYKYSAKELVPIHEYIHFDCTWQRKENWYWIFFDSTLLVCQTDDLEFPKKFKNTYNSIFTFVTNLSSTPKQQINSKRSFLKYPYSNIIGESDVVMQMLNYVDQVIEYTDVQDLIYIHGQTGTGKSILASNIHKYSTRCNQPFIEINCGALVETLCETEFFGIAPNSGISGAPTKGRLGLFELAHGGFLFLDEVSELSLPMQAALLRVAEGATFRRVCGSRNIKVDVRIISASSRDIKKIDKNNFMPELAERLDTIRINIPSLIKRKQDIPLLIEYFCNKLSMHRARNITPEIKQLMLLYHWPGNIRQLSNCLRQCSLKRIPDYLTLTKNIHTDLVPLDIAIDQYTLNIICKRIAIFTVKNNRFSMDDIAQSFSLSREAFRRRLKAIGYTWKQVKKECSQNS
ncbi:sigma 54-interacting transcriptional regulator [Candidatus Uabimicrobium sp. HlEnr_7]|uniref:sigma 54-interacting transcriptional regulator n=1 Tax=Candidatus Uabimicrobium helgolandensis TaxID=3095367 RepID=UPI0035572A82